MLDSDDFSIATNADRRFAELAAAEHLFVLLRCSGNQRPYGAYSNSRAQTLSEKITYEEAVRYAAERFTEFIFTDPPDPADREDLWAIREWEGVAEESIKGDTSHQRLHALIVPYKTMANEINSARSNSKSFLSLRAAGIQSLVTNSFHWQPILFKHWFINYQIELFESQNDFVFDSAKKRNIQRNSMIITLVSELKLLGLQVYENEALSNKSKKLKKSRSICAAIAEAANQVLISDENKSGANSKSLGSFADRFLGLKGLSYESVKKLIKNDKNRG